MFRYILVHTIGYAMVWHVITVHGGGLAPWVLGYMQAHLWPCKVLFYVWNWQSRANMILNNRCRSTIALCVWCFMGVAFLYYMYKYALNNITIYLGGIVIHSMGKLPLVSSNIMEVATECYATIFRFWSQRSRTLPLWEYFCIIYKLVLLFRCQVPMWL